jgi:hypothetical protein
VNAQRHLAIVILTLLAGCSAISATRTIELDAPQTLAPNEVVELRGESLLVRFVTIVSDSRCPKDATCVWAGQVTARFSVRVHEQTQEHEMSVGDTIAIGQRKLSFEAVQPELVTEGKIADERYRVTIRIT